jgi:hypothetical protein
MTRWIEKVTVLNAPIEDDLERFSRQPVLLLGAISAGSDKSGLPQLAKMLRDSRLRYRE